MDLNASLMVLWKKEREDIDKTTTDCQISLENREAKSCVKLYCKKALWKISVRMPKQRAIYAH